MRQQGLSPDEIDQHLQKLNPLVIAALLAAAMSTVSGALNSVATLFSYDLFKRWKPGMSEPRLVMVGRCVTVVGMIVAISWSPFISQFESIFGMLATMICYIAPPITASVSSLARGQLSLA